MKFQSLIISLLLGGLFAYALISFAVDFGTENNAYTLLTQDPLINDTYIGLGTNLTSAYNDVNSSKSAFEKDKPLSGIGSLLFSSLTDIWKTLTKVPQAIYNLTFGTFFQKVFGVNGNSVGFAVAYGIIGAILLIVIILSVWRLIKIGE